MCLIHFFLNEKPPAKELGFVGFVFVGFVGFVVGFVVCFVVIFVVGFVVVLP